MFIRLMTLPEPHKLLVSDNSTIIHDTIENGMLQIPKQKSRVNLNTVMVEKQISIVPSFKKLLLLIFLYTLQNKCVETDIWDSHGGDYVHVCSLGVGSCSLAEVFQYFRFIFMCWNVYIQSTCHPAVGP